MSEDRLERIASQIDKLISGQESLQSGQGVLQRGQDVLQQRVERLERGQERHEERLSDLEAGQLALRRDVQQVAEGHAAILVTMNKGFCDLSDLIVRRLEPLELVVREHSKIARDAQPDSLTLLHEPPLDKTSLAGLP